MTDTTPALIDVLICTYRRPQLLMKTLTGIERCAASVGPIRVVVVDNDDQQSAYRITQQWSQGSRIQLTYLSQPVQNISLTRNVALASATAPWIALIDDDEVPDDNWLAELLATAKDYDADVVIAPVISVFDAAAPVWATQGSIFQRRRFPTGTAMPLKETRTGNVLLRGERIKAEGFRFDVELGLSGGEDSEFFSRLAEARYRMVWCDNACVREWTPLSRTTLTWVLKRAFRIGSVDAYNKRRFGRNFETGASAIKFFAFLIGGGTLAIIWAPFSALKRVQAIRRAALGAGYFYGLFFGPYREYRTVPAAKEIIS